MLRLLNLVARADFSRRVGRILKLRPSKIKSSERGYRVNGEQLVKRVSIRKVSFFAGSSALRAMVFGAAEAVQCYPEVKRLEPRAARFQCAFRKAASSRRTPNTVEALKD